MKKENLILKLWDDGLSIRKISDQTRTKRKYIRKYLRDSNRHRTVSESLKSNPPRKTDQKLIKPNNFDEMVTKLHTIKDLVGYFKVHKRVINRWLNGQKLIKPKKILDYDFLIKEYITNQKSSRVIAKEFKLYNKLIVNSLKTYGLLRTEEENNFKKSVQWSSNFHKHCYKIKEYVTSTGKIFKYQGFEDCWLEVLLSHTNEENILTNRQVPTIDYNLEGKIRKYHPDILDKSTNTLWEIKSSLTLGFAENLLLKSKAVLNAGYNFGLVVYDNKKNLLHIEVSQC